MLKLIAGGIFFLLFVKPSLQSRITHTEPHGNFSMSSTHEIKAADGEKIFIVINVTARVGTKFKLDDGDETTWVYEIIGDGFLSMYNRDNYGARITVSAPVKFLSETSELAIKPRKFRGRDSLFVTYSNYKLKPGCIVSELNHLNGTVQCDFSGDPTHRTAPSCEIRIQCKGDRYQESTTITCLAGRWDGDVECKPIAATVREHCEIDFDQENLELVPGDCPYEVNEVADFLLAEEDAEFGNIGRSSNSCRGRCGCRPRGRYWRRCLYCRRNRCRGRKYLG